MRTWRTPCVSMRPTFGISFENLNLDYSAAVKRSRQVSARLTKGVAFLMKKNNIDVFMGGAKLASKDQVDVTDDRSESPNR